MSTAASDHLVAAIADLERRRARIDAAIEELRTLLRDVYGVSSPRKIVTVGEERAGGQATPRLADEDRSRFRPRPRRDGQPTRAEKVRAVFAENPDKVYDATAIVAAIGEEHSESSLKAVHAVLGRMRKHKLVERVAAGEYRAAGPIPVTASADPDPEGAPGRADTAWNGLLATNSLVAVPSNQGGGGE